MRKLKKNMNPVNKLASMADEDEAIAAYTLIGQYSPYYCLVPDDVDITFVDILACIEGTMHKLLDHHATDDDLLQIMGLRKLTEEDDTGSKDIIYVDLDYVLGSLDGCIQSLEPYYNDETIKTLWQELTDVSFDEDNDGNLILADDFHRWHKGTSRDEIWHWFDHHYSKGILQLA